MLFADRLLRGSVPLLRAAHSCGGTAHRTHRPRLGLALFLPDFLHNWLLSCCRGPALAWGKTWLEPPGRLVWWVRDKDRPVRPRACARGHWPQGPHTGRLQTEVLPHPGEGPSCLASSWWPKVSLACGRIPPVSLPQCHTAFSSVSPPFLSLKKTLVVGFRVHLDKPG